MKSALTSRAYRKAKSLVAATLNSPVKLLALASGSQDKLKGSAQSRLTELLEPIKVSYRLVGAYARGEYRQVSLENLGLIVAALSYFVMPMDTLPDFIVGLGFTDDAAVLAWTFSRVKQELQRFVDWESDQVEQNVIDDAQATGEE